MTTPDSSSIIERIESLESLEGLGYRFIMIDRSFNILCKMGNNQQCCENFGAYTDSALLFDTFIGARVDRFEIGEVTNDCATFGEFGEPDYYASKLKVTIFTDRGEIPIIFYNEHNGYYSHDVIIQSKYLNDIVSL